MTNQPDPSCPDGALGGQEAARCPSLAASDPLYVHSMRADDLVDRRPEAGFLGPADAAPIITLPLRRTYLDACREQGVFQQQEEMRAELFGTKGEMAAMQVERHRLSNGRHDQPKLQLVRDEQAEPTPTTLEEAVAAGREAEIHRMKTICENYRAAGCGDANFPLLMCLLFDVPIQAGQTKDLFEATLQDQGLKPSTNPDMDGQRLNGEGLGMRPFQGRTDQ